MGHTNYIGRVSGDHWPFADLGFGTSGTLSLDLYATAVAQLARQRRIHHRGLHACARVALCGEFGRFDKGSILADDSWRSVVDLNGGVHGVPLCAGEGARHVAEPVIAPTSVLPSTAIGFSDPVAGVRSGKRHDDI